jgi:hypothetical protein
LLPPTGSAIDPKGQLLLLASTDFLRTHDAQTHEIVDAIAAVITNVQAGLNWLRTEPPDLEQAQHARHAIANYSMRAGVPLRALMNKLAHG